MHLSFISGVEIPRGEAVQGREVRESILRLIRTDYPGFSDEGYISIDELNRYRRKLLASLIEQEHGELAQIDLDVMQAIRDNAILSENIQEEMDAALTTGQRLADRIASFGGSWTFIICFFSFLLFW